MFDWKITNIYSTLIIIFKNVFKNTPHNLEHLDSSPFMNMNQVQIKCMLIDSCDHTNGKTLGLPQICDVKMESKPKKVGNHCFNGLAF